MGSRILKGFRLYGPEMIMDVLEERIVLDASVDASAQDNPDNPDNPDNQEQTDSAGQNQDSGDTGGADAAGSSDGSDGGLGDVFAQDLNVVLISNAIDEIESVSAAVDDDATVVVYDGYGDDLAAVTEALQDLVESTGQEIGHLAIVSHGDEGFLVMSRLQVFNAEMVESSIDVWDDLGTLLTDDARIDLYGCDIGQGNDGALLVNAIADATGATVWASDDTTGGVDGGDWDLEVKSAESDQPYLIDGSAMEGVPIQLENTLLVNAGFEYGDTRGWTVSEAPVSVVEGDSSSYGGIPIATSPYAGSSNYILQVDVNSGADYDNEPAVIYQDFWVTSADTLEFAYNFVTDGDYSKESVHQPPPGYDDFGYEISLVGGGVIARIVPEGSTFDAGNIWPDVEGYSRSTGWQIVTVDLSAYVGQQVRITLWSGNTDDTNYPSWGFFDFDTSTINDPPVLDVPDAQNTDEDVSIAIGGVSVADVDAGSNDITLTLTMDYGVLTVGDSVIGGLSASDISGNGTDTVILTGSQFEINATLADAMGITYTPTLNFNGDATLTVESNDGGSTGVGGPLTFTETVTITVDPVNDPAVITVPGDQTTDEDVALAISGVSVSDADAGSNDITVTLTVSNGTIDVSDTVSGGLTSGEISGNGTSTVILTGTQDQINLTLADVMGITYTPTENYYGSDTLTLESNDGGATGGPAQIYTETIDITVDPVDDPAVIGPIPDPAAVYEDFGTTTYDVHWSFSDPDATLTYELKPVDYSGLLSDLTIDPTTGIITFTSLENAYGSIDIDVRVFDGTTYWEYQTFTFTVLPVDDRPTTEEQIITVDVGDSVTFKVYGYDLDEPESGEWTFVYDDTSDLHGTLIPGALTDEGNGVYSMEFTFVPDADYEGRDSFEFTFYTDGPGTLTEDSGEAVGSATGGGYTYSVQLADVDGDGDPDMITGTNGGTDNGNKVYYYDQSLGEFVDSGLGFGTDDTYDIQVIDINGDDLPDVVEDQRQRRRGEVLHQPGRRYRR